MPGQRSLLKQFTINLTMLDGVARDVDDVEVRLAVIDGLRRCGLGGTAGFEVTVSEPPVTGWAEHEPAARQRSAPGHTALDAIEHAWSIAAQAVIQARIAERSEQAGRPAEDGERAPGRTARG
jgi:hypothetical protein